MGKIYHVFAGPADDCTEQNNQKWRILNVPESKYFTIQCKGKFGGWATLGIKTERNNKNSFYMFAENIISNDCIKDTNLFTIIPND